MGRNVGDLYYVNEVASGSVPAATSSVRLSGPVDGRKQALIYNYSQASMFLKFGDRCTSEDFSLLLAPYSYYEMPSPCYEGPICALWTQATGSAKVTQFT